MIKLPNDWQKILDNECNKPYFKELSQFVDGEYQTQTIFPPKEQIYNAFNLCAYAETTVVILGQDPYHGEGQADGLCFSVCSNIKIPPSLRNIYRELEHDLTNNETTYLSDQPRDGHLAHWAKQGVLLLNATLTVRAHKAGSHQNKGWERFTDAVINKIATQKEQVVFILWGAYAQKKVTLIDETKHLIIQSTHPSPFSAYKGFFGHCPFSKTNNYLRQHKMQEIKW